MQEFRLTPLIRAHNQKHPQRKIPRNKNWGMIYLSRRGLKLLNQTPLLFLTLNTDHYCRSEISHAGQYRQFVQAFKEHATDKEALAHARPVLNELQTMARSKNLREQEKSYVEYLSNPVIWDAFTRLSPAYAHHIADLKQFWQSQQQFALVSNDFLRNFYQGIISALQLVQEADNELQQKRQRLPEDIAELMVPI